MPENYTTSRTFHALKKCARSRQSKVATGRISGSIPSRDIHFCSRSVQPALELLVQGVLGAVFPGVKWLEREADQSLRPVLYLRVELIPHAFMTCIETDNCSQEYWGMLGTRVRCLMFLSSHSMVGTTSATLLSGRNNHFDCMTGQGLELVWTLRRGRVHHPSRIDVPDRYIEASSRRM